MNKLAICLFLAIVILASGCAQKQRASAADICSTIYMHGDVDSKDIVRAYGKPDDKEIKRIGNLSWSVEFWVYFDATHTCIILLDPFTGRIAREPLGGNLLPAKLYESKGRAQNG
jgi:hypothetical protein